MSPNCPEIDLLRRFMEGSLSGQEEQAVCEHVDACAECQRRLEVLEADSEPLAYLGSATSSDSKALKQRLEGLRQLPAGAPRSPDAMVRDLKPWLTDDGSERGHPKIGEFELLDCIGRGGMGVVFRAEDTKLGRRVALKFMSPGLLADPTAAERFLREARAAAAINHPNVVTIHSVGEFRELPYLVMELVEGEPLSVRLDQGPLSVEEVLAVAKQIAEGLRAAHKAGVTHRDVKPANILIERDSGAVKLTDFGLARTMEGQSLTQSGLLVGTPEFVSPEQFDPRFGTVDHRSDLFSFGVVLYAMVAGNVPFSAPSVLGTLNQVCNAEPEPLEKHVPSVPSWLAQLIARLLEKDPACRPASAAEVANVIANRSTSNGSPAPPPIAPAPVVKAVPRFPRKSKSTAARSAMPLAAVVACLCVALIGGVIYAVNRGNQPSQGARTAATVETASDENRPAMEARGPQTRPERIEDEEPRFAPPQRKAVRVSDSGQLIRAIETASDSIEIVLAADEFQLRAFSIDACDVEFSAAEGFSPVLTITPSQFGTAIHANDSLFQMSGLSVRSGGDRRDQDLEEEVDAFIVVDGGEFIAQACSFELNRETPCLHIAAADAELTHCNVSTPASTAIQWLPEEFHSLTLENNVIVSEVGLSLDDQFGERLRLQDNTFVGSITLECGVEHVGSELTVFAEGNVFDAAETMFLVYGDDVDTDLAAGLRWKGGSNVFPHTIVLAFNEDDEEEFRLDDLDGFREVVDAEEQGSVQRAPVYPIGSEQLERQREAGTLQLDELRLRDRDSGHGAYVDSQ